MHARFAAFDSTLTAAALSSQLGPPSTSSRLDVAVLSFAAGAQPPSRPPDTCVIAHLE